MLLIILKLRKLNKQHIQFKDGKNNFQVSIDNYFFIAILILTKFFFMNRKIVIFVVIFFIFLCGVSFVKKKEIKNVVRENILRFLKYDAKSVSIAGVNLVAIDDKDGFYDKAKNLLTPYDLSMNKVRIGRDFDGGYVTIDEVIKDSNVVLSYGVADDISFEEDVLQKYSNIENIYASDCSVDELPISNLSKNLIEKMIFSKTCVGNKGTSGLYKSDGNEVFLALEEQIKNLKISDKKIFIKMDIEGGEYSSFDGVSDDIWSKVTGIVVEVHWINDFANHQKFIDLISILNKNFTLINIHGNNNGPLVIFADYEKNLIALGRNLPAVLELSYVNNKYAESKKISTESFPSSLDKNNKKFGFDYVVDFHLNQN